MNNVVSLNDLFHERVFQVPDYQRGYSWESQHVREFLEDLELLGPKGYHYTGTVVLHKLTSEERRMDEDGRPYSSVAIVDGQQRLTTIVILLDEICRLLAEAPNELDQVLSNGIKKNYISVRSSNGELLYKLTLNQDTDHYFQTSILSTNPNNEGPLVSSQKRLQSTQHEIRSYLCSKTNNGSRDSANWLRALYEKVATQLRFTVYQVEREAEVGVIFEVMNDRGKTLTELEKVKNFLLYSSVFLENYNEPNELAKSVNDTWSAILVKLMSAGLESSANEDQLLYVNWLTNYDPQSRHWKGSRNVKDQFALREHREQGKKLLNELNSYTKKLRQDCVAFCDARSPERHDAFNAFKKWNSVRDDVRMWSAKLVRIGVIAPFLPLLLAARSRWSDEPKKYLKILKLCEAFAFRVYGLSESRSDAGQVNLFRLGHNVQRRKVSFEAMLETVKAELARLCSQEDFENYTDAAKPGNWYEWSSLKYFLYEYESHLANLRNASPKVTWDELYKHGLKDTLEHILPQTIDNQPYWKKRFPKKRHERYVHDLGNLTLTRHNSHYSNKSFPDKKGEASASHPCFAKSPLFMEQELTQSSEWTTKEINNRRSKLLEWARERWAVDLEGIL